ncbi:MAG: TolC family protein [Planctomycetaceae bacterium]
MRSACRQFAARIAFAFVVISAAWLPNPAFAQLRFDEQHSIRWHRPEEIVTFRRPANPVPVTVATVSDDAPERFLSLDEAIRIALQNSEVIRVLAGTAAVSSGSTIYDTAIATTPIDQAVGRFDPVFFANSNWRKSEQPGQLRSGGNDLSIGLNQTNRLGGVAGLTFGNNFSYGSGALPFSTTQRPSLELSYTQPLLSGAGRAANEAPIVIARLQQDQSYFQFKDSMQELVRGVVAAYWNLVQARTELWAREKQVEQADFALERAEAQFRAERVRIADVAQPKVSYNNFRANLIAARGNVLQTEAALRNMLGLPPEDGSRIVPSTPPTRDRVEFHWEELIDTAQIRRPDLIELNLILLADQQRLVQARNVAQPTLNAVGVQSWNGLTGRTAGTTFGSELNDNPSWTLGVTFQVPLGLRQARAAARSSELLIARDRANIAQGIHQVEHQLATTVRSLDQAYLQYEAFREVRQAASVNLEVQFAEEQVGRVIFLNVLQAINDWGNSVASEASALTQYNSQLATLERQTGTVLEVHGVTFVEERFAAIGPHGRHFEPDCYPRDLRAADSAPRYEDSGEAAEEFFELDDYPHRRPKPDPVDAPGPPRDVPAEEPTTSASSSRHFSLRTVRDIFR